MMEREYLENKDGVHLASAFNAEYSLCGCAFDAGSTGDNDAGDLMPTIRRTVTCKQCIREIKNCRGVKIKDGE